MPAIATAASYPTKSDEEIVHYAFEDLILPGHTLALNTTLGVLSLFAQDTTWPYPHLLAQQQFTETELSLLLPLFSLHPSYCPYEVLIASFEYRTVTDATVERSRKKLHHALEVGAWDAQLRPIRNILSRNRVKLRVFNIDIASILETGCALMPPSTRKRYALWENGKS